MSDGTFPEFHLQFGTVIKLADDLPEVIPADGNLVTVPMVEEFIECVNREFSAPFRVLVNRKFSYTYDFDAQLLLSEMEHVRATAVLIYNNKAAQVATESMALFPREQEWNMQTFDDRDKAIAWLDSLD